MGLRRDDMRDKYHEEQIDNYVATQAFIMHMNLAYEKFGQVTITDAVQALEVYKKEIALLNPPSETKV